MSDAFSALGRKLRIGVVGGGPGSFIGPMHRAAALLDRRFEIVAGVLSSDPAKSRAAAAALGIASYPSVAAIIAGEPALDAAGGDDAERSPHRRNAATAMAAGLHVVCDKPLTNSLADARELAALAACSASGCSASPTPIPPTR